MTLTYSEDGVTVDMKEYIQNMIDEFSIELGDSVAPTPATDDLFTIGDSNDLNGKRAEELHTFVAKGLFLCKRARPDINTLLLLDIGRYVLHTSRFSNIIINLQQLLPFKIHPKYLAIFLVPSSPM
jgi:hypothetical protein